MRTNERAKDFRKDYEARTAGGFGPYAAKQSPEALLRRAVMANLLWEGQFYQDGKSVADEIIKLIPLVEPNVCAQIAIEARYDQKLRHVPLLIVREMAKHDSHKGLVAETLATIINRADELTEFLSLYWLEGKKPIAAQVKKGLAGAFNKFDAYGLAKYNRDNAIKLRDVMFLVHPKPTQSQVEIFKKLAEGTLEPPDTWEVALSTGKDKKETWERLIQEQKLGALAFMRNLRNFESAEVSRDIINRGFETINPRWLLPLNYLSAAKAVPKWEREIEELMYRGLSTAPKLPGWTIFVVDVSRSMDAYVSLKSDFSRLDVSCAMTILAAEMCEHISVYDTAGDDCAHKHATKILKPRRGFALASEIKESRRGLGGGGIFTRQCLEYIREQERETPDRIIIFSDSQDCDYPNSRTPNPWGKRNYIIDVSAHTKGIAYEGLWTAEVSGWSEHFLKFIAALEGAHGQEEEEE